MFPKIISSNGSVEDRHLQLKAFIMYIKFGYNTFRPEEVIVK
jgi:hypothetical protein